MDERSKFEERGKFEHELLNRRVTWLLTSQTILFAAYGLSISEKSDGKVFREVIPIVGIVLSSIILIGIIAAFIAKIVAWRDFRSSDEKYKKEPLGIKTWITVMGYIPDFFIPIIFTVAWSYLLTYG